MREAEPVGVVEESGGHSHDGQHGFTGIIKREQFDDLVQPITFRTPEREPEFEIGLYPEPLVLPGDEGFQNSGGSRLPAAIWAETPEEA